jgi:ribosome-binding protein aMBF1 (putative translation factor)
MAATQLECMMPLIRACENCGTPTPVYRLAAVILDGHIAEICPRCAASEQARIDLPYSPRVDQGAIQPSTGREAW